MDECTSMALQACCSLTKASLAGFSSQVKHYLLGQAFLGAPHARCPGSLYSQHFLLSEMSTLMCSMPVTPPECRFHEESDLLICHHSLSTAFLPGSSGMSEKWMWVASWLQRPHRWSAMGSPAYPAGGRGSIREQGTCSMPGCPVSAETGGADSRAQLGGRPPSHAQLGRISFCCSRLFLTVHTVSAITVREETWCLLDMLIASEKKAQLTALGCLTLGLGLNSLCVMHLERSVLFFR